MHRNRLSAFTLIETAVLVAIVSLVVGVAIPAVLKSREDAREAGIRALKKTLSDGCMRAAMEDKAVPEASRANLAATVQWYKDQGYIENRHVTVEPGMELGEDGEYYDCRAMVAGNVDADPPGTTTPPPTTPNTSSSVISFSTSAVSVLENVGLAQVGLTRKGSTAEAASIMVYSQGGSATLGEDFQGIEYGTHRVSFAAGEAVSIVTIPIIDDADVEGEESFTLWLSDPSAGTQMGTPFSAKVNILDNDAVGPEREAHARFSIAQSSVDENAGVAQIKVLRTGTHVGDTTVTVDFTVEASWSGLATADSDFVPTSGTLTFPPGVTEAFISVTVVDDATAEEPEKFVVNLDDMTATPSEGMDWLDWPDDHEVTIIDNDTVVTPVPATIQFLQTDSTWRETDGSVTAVVRRTGPDVHTAGATVEFEAWDGDAVAGEDYVATTGTITFEPGQTEAIVTVPLINDNVSEYDYEYFGISLFDPSAGYEIGDVADTYPYIIDDEPWGTSDRETYTFFKNSNTTVVEGNVIANLTIMRRGTYIESTSAQVFVGTQPAQYGTTATAWEDFATNSTWVNFAPGQVEATVGVQIMDDRKKESTEVIAVWIDNPLQTTPASAYRGSDDPRFHYINIIDDDTTASMFALDTDEAVVSENEGTVYVTVRRTGPGLDKAASVAYATQDYDDAIAGEDFTSAAGRAEFAPGQATVVIALPILDNSTIEDEESFGLEIFDPSPGYTVDDWMSWATVYIVDDDASNLSGFSFAQDDSYINEPAGNIVIGVIRTSPDAATTSATVDYATSNYEETEMARPVSDYEARSGTLTFSPGQTYAEINIPIVDDGVSEEEIENFRVSLSNPTLGYSVRTPDFHTVGIIDNDGNPDEDDNASGDRPCFEQLPSDLAGGAGVRTYLISTLNPCGYFTGPYEWHEAMLEEGMHAGPAFTGSILDRPTETLPWLNEEGFGMIGYNYPWTIVYHGYSYDGDGNLIDLREPNGGDGSLLHLETGLPIPSYEVTTLAEVPHLELPEPPTPLYYTTYQDANGFRASTSRKSGWNILMVNARFDDGVTLGQAKHPVYVGLFPWWDGQQVSGFAKVSAEYPRYFYGYSGKMKFRYNFTDLNGVVSQITLVGSRSFAEDGSSETRRLDLSHLIGTMGTVDLPLPTDGPITANTTVIQPPADSIFKSGGEMYYTLDRFYDSRESSQSIEDTYYVVEIRYVTGQEPAAP